MSLMQANKIAMAIGVLDGLPLVGNVTQILSCTLIWLQV